MTADEFERAYCDRSGMTVDAMHALGRRVRPCACDYTGCDGWQMVSDDNWADPFVRFQAGVITRDEMNAEYKSLAQFYPGCD